MHFYNNDCSELQTQFSPLKNDNIGLRALLTLMFAQFLTTFYKIKKLIQWPVSEILGSGSASYPVIDSRNPCFQYSG
jgi:hypothetical protein